MTKPSIKAAILAGVWSVALLSVISPTGKPLVLPTDASPLVAVTPGGERKFSVEVADDDDERAAGLMYRVNMDASHGMLFVYARPRNVHFWMKDTPMPLDLIFIGGDGRVTAVLRGEPHSEADVSPGRPALAVLEIKAGTAEAYGIRAGTEMRHPALEALRDPQA